MAGTFPANPGELNYQIHRCIFKYLGLAPGYERYNDVLGVLTAVQHELYRRMIAPYEDKKIVENGEVYP